MCVCNYEDLGTYVYICIYIHNVFKNIYKKMFTFSSGSIMIGLCNLFISVQDRILNLNVRYFINALHNINRILQHYSHPECVLSSMLLSSDIMSKNCV